MSCSSSPLPDFSPAPGIDSSPLPDSSLAPGSLEVANALPIFHGRLAHPVVRARLAALRDVRGGDLGDHLVDRRRLRDDAAGTGHVADGPEANEGRERDLTGVALDVGADRVEHSVAPEDVAPVREVDRREFEPLARDVLPDVELGPVRDRKHADVLTLADARVEEVPELRTLGPRVPLAEVVAEAEDALFRPRTLLVAARAAHRRIEAVLGDRVEQRRRLELVPRRARARLLDDAAAVDRLLHACDDEPLAELGDTPVAKLEHLREVVAGVDVHDGERQLAGPERLLREAQQHDRVLAAGEEQHGPLQLGGDLTHDVDRLRLELVEVRERANAGRSDHAATSFSSSSSSSRRRSVNRTDSWGVRPTVSSRSSASSGSS